MVTLRDYREQIGISQLDAALLLGVSRPTYVKWENNLDTMPIGKYNQLQKEFKRLEGKQ